MNNSTSLQTRNLGKQGMDIDIRGMNSELAREKMWGRIHIMPLLQAEEDRDQARRYFADKAREKELLGTDAKIYNSDRYVLSTRIRMSIGLGKANQDSYRKQLCPPYLHVYPQQGHSISAWKIIKFMCVRLCCLLFAQIVPFWGRVPCA